LYSEDYISWYEIRQDLPKDWYFTLKKRNIPSTIDYWKYRNLCDYNPKLAEIYEFRESGWKK
jgi:hypothetical protein